MPKREEQELSPDAVERITRGIRSLAEDRVERGVDLTRPVRCDSCGLEKASAGSARYGAYKLCNDCLLDFTLDLARGRVDNVVDYMRRPDDAGSPPDLNDGREARGVGMNPLPGRDKLMPRNEPC